MADICQKLQKGDESDDRTTRLKENVESLKKRLEFLLEEEKRIETERLESALEILLFSIYLQIRI